ESFRLADRGGQGRTGHHTDARDCRQPTPRAWIDHCHVESPVRGMDEHLPKPASHRRAARSPQGHAAKWNGARLPFGENLRALVICLRFTQGIAFERLATLLSDLLATDRSFTGRATNGIFN